MVEPQVVEQAHQITELGIVQHQRQRRGVGLAAVQLKPVAALVGIGADPHRPIGRTERTSHSADQVPGVGKNHLHERQQMLLAALQLGPAGPLQGPAGDDPYRIAGLADGDIGKPLHLQAATELFVAEGLFDHGRQGWRAGGDSRGAGAGLTRRDRRGWPGAAPPPPGRQPG